MDAWQRVQGYVKLGFTAGLQGRGPDTNPFYLQTCHRDIETGEDFACSPIPGRAWLCGLKVAEALKHETRGAA